MKVLVTGAAGFIGSHLVADLVSKGHEVTALVRYSSSANTSYSMIGSAFGWGSTRIVAGDICDLELVDRTVAGQDAVIHLAALIGIPYSYLAPRSYVHVNVEGTLNLLESCRRYGVRILTTSTSEVYGTAQSIPMSTSHRLNAQSPYAASKVAADQLALSYQQSFDLDVTVVRPFNTFGPRQSPRAVLPSIVSQALAFGVVNVGSLDTKRDFNYVKNTVDGFIRVLDSNDVSGRVIAFGSGEMRSVGEALEMIEAEIGHKLQVNVQSDRIRPAKSEVQALICDNSEAGELVGYSPEVSFQEGLKRLLEFWRTDPTLVEVATVVRSSLSV